MTHPDPRVLLVKRGGIYLQEEEDVKFYNSIYAWIPRNLSFRYINCTGQFTPNMKATAEPRLLSSLLWIDPGIKVSQHCLESVNMK